MLDKPYVIHYRRPYRCLFLVTLVLVIAMVAAWYWSHQWRLQQTENLTALQGQYEQLLTENQNLVEKNQTLMTELQSINQLQAIQQATDSQLQTELEAVQDELIQLNKELLFYQNITQGKVSSELQVRELHLRQNTDDPSSFHYRLVITQGKKIAKAIRGKVALTLQIKNAEQTSSRELNEHALNIRHVQVLEGTLKLTENEQPISIHVALKQGTKKLAERTFEWDATPSP